MRGDKSVSKLKPRRAIESARRSPRQLLSPLSCNGYTCECAESLEEVPVTLLAPRADDDRPTGYTSSLGTISWLFLIENPDARARTALVSGFPARELPKRCPKAARPCPLIAAILSPSPPPLPAAPLEI